MCIKGANGQRGITLVELVLFIVIVGIALAGILSVMNLTTKHSADPLRRKQALMLAEALLEEVELAQFSYCEPGSDNADTATSVSACTTPETFGAEPGEARPFDNVNDYANAPGNRPFDINGQLTDVTGNALPLQGYSATLTMKAEDLPGITGGTNANPNVLHITVTVSYDNGQSVTLDGYRTRYAPQVE